MNLFTNTLLRFMLALFIAELCLPIHSTEAAAPHWATKDMPITFYLRKTPKLWAGRSSSQMASLVKKSILMWESISCSSISIWYVGLTNKQAKHNDGFNVIEWVRTLPSNNGESYGIGGFTPEAGRSGQFNIFDADIWLKVKPYTDSALINVLAHEIGHTIGLHHTPLNNTIMSAVHSSKTKLHSDDKNALCRHYPNVKCETRSSCSFGRVCSFGLCRKCTNNNQCKSGEKCSEGLCLTSCSKSQHCGANQGCYAQKCLPRHKIKCKSHKNCKGDEYCRKGWCRPQNELTQICTNVNKQCYVGQVCTTPICTKKFGCGKGFTCHFQGSQSQGICLGKIDQQVNICTILCDKNKQCPHGFVCEVANHSYAICYPERPPNSKEETTHGLFCSSTKKTPDITAILFIIGAIITFGLRRQKFKARP